MRLELGKIFIKDIIFDEGESRIEDHILYLNKKELADVSGVADDEHLESIDFDIAHPGESMLTNQELKLKVEKYSQEY